MKELILVRGLPGSGKSTLAKTLGGDHYEADMYFQRGVDDVYQFDVSKLKDAHQWCKMITEVAMMGGKQRIVISNTFTQQWEMDNYFALAKQYDYMVFTIIVENRHGGENIHNVPDETLQKMGNRFEIQL